MAHRDDYLDETFVYRTVERGVTEVEPAFDSRSRPDGRDFRRYRLGVEHGFTDRFMLDGFASVDDARRSGSELGLWRLETRYRFGEENPHGVSPAVSLEYEDDRLERDRRLTPRLILNRDFEQFNATLNLFREIEVSGAAGSAWGYSLGSRYGDEEARVRYGVELKQTFGREARGIVIPQLFIKLAEGVDAKIGYARALTRRSESFVRLLFEFELGGKD